MGNKPRHLLTFSGDHPHPTRVCLPILFHPHRGEYHGVKTIIISGEGAAAGVIHGLLEC